MSIDWKMYGSASLEKLERDDFGIVLYTDDNCRIIAEVLKDKKNVLVCLACSDTTIYDILIAYKPEKTGYHQRGILYSQFFVSIIGRSNFGFTYTDTINNALKHDSYYSEKLNISGTKEVRTITKFLNGVIKWLYIFNAFDANKDATELESIERVLTKIEKQINMETEENKD